METNTPNAGPRSYAVPDIGSLETLDSEEISTTLKQLQSDMYSDPNHPRMKKEHPLNKDYAEYTNRLFERAAEGRESGEEKLVREANEYMAEKQAKLDREGLRLREELIHDYDFEPVDVQPGSTKPWQIDVWKMQKQWATKDYLPLASALETESRKIGKTQDVAPLLAILRDVSASEGLRDEIAERMILSLNNAKLKGNL